VRVCDRSIAQNYAVETTISVEKGSDLEVEIRAAEKDFRQ